MLEHPAQFYCSIELAQAQAFGRVFIIERQMNRNDERVFSQLLKENTTLADEWKLFSSLWLPYQLKEGGPMTALDLTFEEIREGREQRIVALFLTPAETEEFRLMVKDHAVQLARHFRKKTRAHWQAIFENVAFGGTGDVLQAHRGRDSNKELDEDENRLRQGDTLYRVVKERCIDGRDPTDWKSQLCRRQRAWRWFQRSQAKRKKLERKNQK